MPASEREFEAVAMPHMAVLLRAALRLSAERMSAEDLVQETYLLAWRSFSQFQPGTNCKAWLFTIMLNLLGKRSQKLRKLPQIMRLDPDESAPVKVFSTAKTPPRFTVEEVFTALDAMQEGHRSVLILAVVEGFTCKEIAGMLAIPIGTVMSRLSRARASLRNALERSEQSAELAAHNVC